METIELGGNIVLTGFSTRDFTEMIIVKKIVGQYTRKLTDTVDGFRQLHITLKEIHSTKVEIIAKADVDGKEYASETVQHNLFVALDSCLKHVLAQAHKSHEKKLEH
jgi:hypothetical protein